MEPIIKVTNEKRYNQIDVDVSGLEVSYNGTIHGTISIDPGNGEGWKDYTGEHGAYDYEEEFGFVLETKKK